MCNCVAKGHACWIVASLLCVQFYALTYSTFAHLHVLASCPSDGILLMNTQQPSSCLCVEGVANILWPAAHFTVVAKCISKNHSEASH